LHERDSSSQVGTEIALWAVAFFAIGTLDEKGRNGNIGLQIITCYKITEFSRGVRGGIIVFNATFNNISGITWWSVLLMEETGVPEGNH
jgi:hypothetical protein